MKWNTLLISEFSKSLSALWLWLSYLNTLCLSVLIYKMDIMLFTSEAWVRIKWLNKWQALRTAPANSKCSINVVVALIIIQCLCANKIFHIKRMTWAQKDLRYSAHILFRGWWVNRGMKLMWELQNSARLLKSTTKVLMRSTNKAL